MLCRLAIAFLLRSKRLLISWLQSLSAVMVEPKRIKNKVINFIKKQGKHPVVGPLGPKAPGSVMESLLLKFVFIFLWVRDRETALYQNRAASSQPGRTIPISDPCTADVRNPFPLPVPFKQSKC